MTDTIEYTIDIQDPGFFKALENPDGFLPFLDRAMANTLTAFQAVAEIYAPESEANRPGRVDENGDPMGYYERGRGWWYPLLTHNTMGMAEEIPVIGPHSKSPTTLKSIKTLAIGIKGVAGYKLIPNSQQMHDRWTWDVNHSSGEVIGHLMNSATYSPYVQGMEQDPLHRVRGWSTVMDSWEDDLTQSTVMDEVKLAVDAYFLYGEG